MSKLIQSDPRPIFKPYIEELRLLYSKLSSHELKSVTPKKQQWLGKLKAVDMAPRNVSETHLFLAHSFLVTFTRGIIHVLTKPDKKPKAKNILTDGFIVWINSSPNIQQWANRLLLQICNYEWRQRSGDILRPIYEIAVSEGDRRDFGEFYTPDWLAEMLAREICNEEWCNTSVRKVFKAHRKGKKIKGIGVLDPTCGSGVFLYYAAKQLLACSQIKKLSDEDKAGVVCTLIHGIDIHPITVEIARVNVLRTLPVEPPQGVANLRIYEGDVLMRQWHINSLFQIDREQVSPHILRVAERKVNRIIANPPWLTLSGVQTPSRKKALKRFANREDIKIGNNFDIAQLFVKRARQLYLASPDTDPAAWLVKKSALKAKNWGKFRKWHKSICKQTWDLETLNPFGGGDSRSCCVLFENCTSSYGKTRHNLVAHTTDRLTADMNFEDAIKLISFHTTPLGVPCDESDYIDTKGKPLFKAGVPSVPRVLIVIDNVTKLDDQNVEISTITSRHPPWSTLSSQSGIIPATWIRKLMIAESMVPFKIITDKLWRMIVPTNSNGMLESSVIASRKSDFWKSAEEIYKCYQSDGSNVPTFIDYINSGARLDRQLILNGKSKKMVIYPSAGSSDYAMRGCRICPGMAVIDATLNWYIAKSASEAAYLVGILNAPCLIKAFNQSKSSGRNFHRDLWLMVPIPKFNREDPDHRALVKLTKRAEKLVKSYAHILKPDVSQAAISSQVREKLHADGISDEIDTVVRRILPHQTQGAQP